MSLSLLAPAGPSAVPVPADLYLACPAWRADWEPPADGRVIPECSVQRGETGRCARPAERSSELPSPADDPVRDDASHQRCGEGGAAARLGHCGGVRLTAAVAGGAATGLARVRGLSGARGPRGHASVTGRARTGAAAATSRRNADGDPVNAWPAPVGRPRGRTARSPAAVSALSRACHSSLVAVRRRPPPPPVDRSVHRPSLSDLIHRSPPSTFCPPPTSHCRPTPSPVDL